MKILYLLLLITLLENVSCREQIANGQSGSISNTNKSIDVNASSNSANNADSNRVGSDIMANSNLSRETNVRINPNDEKLPYVKTQNKPAGKLIKLKEVLINKDLNNEQLGSVDWGKISETLGSKNFCQSDVGEIYNIEKETYILGLGCNVNTYYAGYLYYFIDEKAMSAELISFERFEQNERNKQIEKHIFNYMIGESGFDEDTKTMYFREFYYAGGQCGWESGYKFIKATAILTNFKAEWNCEKGTEFESWKKMDLKTLERTTKKTVYDKFKD